MTMIVDWTSTEVPGVLDKVNVGTLQSKFIFMFNNVEIWLYRK